MSAPFDELTEVAVVDCETTGVDPEQDRIVSLAVVLTDLSKPSAQDAPAFEAKLNPGIPIPAGATRVHGLRDQDVAECPSFGDIAQALKDFVGDRPLVGFNVRFDKRFLNAELKRAGLVTFAGTRSHSIQRTLERTWGYLPSLDNALARMRVLGFDGKLHHALNDVLATTSLAVLVRTLTREQIAQVSGSVWTAHPNADDPPSDAQLTYIATLGGNPSSVMTKQKASEAIEHLKAVRRAKAHVAVPVDISEILDTHYSDQLLAYEDPESGVASVADEVEPTPEQRAKPERPSILLMLAGMLVFWTLLALAC